MFASLIREGEIVRLPSGRLGQIETYSCGFVDGVYLDDGEPWVLSAKLLVHVSSKLAGGMA